jgi:subtilase family serine protease
MHEVMIFVKMNNFDTIQDMLDDRSTPGNENYQDWLTLDEIGQLTRNEEGYQLISHWLLTSGANITWTTRFNLHIVAEAPIHVWEKLLDTKFHAWMDTSSSEPQLFDRSYNYSVPDHLARHIDHIFKTSQPPPPSPHRHMRLREDFVRDHRAAWETESYGITVSFLNSLYKIPSNLGA